MHVFKADCVTRIFWFRSWTQWSEPVVYVESSSLKSLWKQELSTYYKDKDTLIVLAVAEMKTFPSRNKQWTFAPVMLYV